MQQEEKVDGKRVIAKGFGWRKLEGGDERRVWDPKDKDKLKELLPTYKLIAIVIGIIFLLRYFGVE